MTRPTLLAALSLLALAGCDRMPFLQGGGEGNSAATANASSGNASAAAPASAGIGQSRSLAGLSGSGSQAGQESQGSKDATAIPASSSEGGVDPRLIGRWTDTGDCKTVTELRADGTFVSNDGAVGRWEVNGNDLVFSGNGNEYRLHIESLEAGRVVTTTPQGQSGASTRC